LLRDQFPDGVWIDLLKSDVFGKYAAMPHLLRDEISVSKPSWVVIDEIQKVRDWSNILKILFDRDRKKNKLRVVLSGSASLSLQSVLSESLTGRYEVIRCPHWGLDDSRAAFNWDLSTYLRFGGYPSAADLIHDVNRWRAFLRDSIIEPVIGRDLQTSVTIQKSALLR
jgi:predicted AAA+ superfamily ATPase